MSLICLDKISRRYLMGGETIHALREVTLTLDRGEYVAIMTMCAIGTILFLGGWLPPFPVAPFTWLPGIFWFILKISFLFFLFAMAKAIVPRYRYDQLMRLGWKVFLPITLVMVVAVAAVLMYFGLAPR